MSEFNVNEIFGQFHLTALEFVFYLFRFSLQEELYLAVPLRQMSLNMLDHNHANSKFILIYSGYKNQLGYHMRNQYSLINHSILPLVYRIISPKAPGKLNYVLKDPQTRSLLLFNPKIQGNYDWILDHIKQIQEQSQCKLTHIITNLPLKNPQELPFKKLNNSVSYFMPASEHSLKPKIIGQLSICYISAPGYDPNYHLIGVTHMTNNSTKLPCLFVDEAIGVCTIDCSLSIKQNEYLKTLDIVKYFPHETFIFPDQLVKQKDLMFAKALFQSVDANSPATLFISHKLAQFKKQHKQKVDCLLPTSVLQQKKMNPFLNSNNFEKLLMESGGGKGDRNKYFGLLRGMKREWDSNREGGLRQ